MAGAARNFLQRGADAVWRQRGADTFGLMPDNGNNSLGRRNGQRRSHDMFNQRETAGAVQNLRGPRFHACAETGRQNNNRK